MTLRDRLLPAVNRIRGLRQRLGITVNTVRIRVETWTAAIGTTGATCTTVDTLMDPQPRVTKLNAEESAFVMAAYPAAQTGRGQRAFYKLEWITPKHATGGYSLADLFGGETASDRKRLLVMLAGDSDLGDAPGTAFEVIQFDTSAPFHTTLIVGRAQDFT